MNRIVLIFSALALFTACEKYEDEVVTFAHSDPPILGVDAFDGARPWALSKRK